jgi:phosphoserine phosphatase
MSQRVINAFDFDGTLINGDSIKHFARWVSRSKLEFYFKYYGLLVCFMSVRKLKYIRSNYFYSLMIRRKLDMLDFDEVLEVALFADSIDLIKSCKEEVVVVSASYNEIIGGFCQRVLGVEVLANSYNNPDLDVNHNQKVLALRDKYGSGLALCKAFGNSSGDLPLLFLAEKGFWRTTEGELIEFDKQIVKEYEI